MKKSLLALAVLGTLAGAAAAQSSVTLYGRVDLSVARNLGTDYMVMQNGSGSRLGVRGVEDLGGGLKAMFQVEHRFNADTGAQTAAVFWHGRSIVGLQGGFGEVRFGREYTPSFLYVELAADPWGFDTVATPGTNLRGRVAAVPGTTALDPVRRDNTITYSSPNLSGFQGHFQWAMDEIRGNDRNGNYSLALTYRGGPLWVGFAHDRRDDADAVAGPPAIPAEAKNTWNLLAASYDFGMAKLIGAYGDGKTGSTKIRDYHIAVTAPVGGGEFRAAYNKAENRTTDTDLSSIFSLGYHYALSKRTTVYTDYARDGELTDNKWGFDVGIKHNF